MARKAQTSRGLGAASKETRARVARAGGTAYHSKRGRSGSDGAPRKTAR